MSKLSKPKEVWVPAFPGSKLMVKAFIMNNIEWHYPNLKVGESKRYDGYKITRFN